MLSVLLRANSNPWLHGNLIWVASHLHGSPSALVIKQDLQLDVSMCAQPNLLCSLVLLVGGEGNPHLGM